LHLGIKRVSTTAAILPAIAFDVFIKLRRSISPNDQAASRHFSVWFLDTQSNQALADVACRLQYL
jgi:hypothetical protein